MKEQEKLTKEQYNDIPVHYCTRCLSLRIKTIGQDADLDYCDDCGGTEIKTARIYEWEALYKNKYGHKLINN